MDKCFYKPEEAVELNMASGEKKAALPMGKMILPVTIGNIIGGMVVVGGLCFLIYKRKYRVE